MRNYINSNTQLIDVLVKWHTSFPYKLYTVCVSFLLLPFHQTSRLILKVKKKPQILVTKKTIGIFNIQGYDVSKSI